MARKPFSKWEKDFIYLAYPEFDNKDIAETINRSKGVIQVFASNLNYKKAPKIRNGDVFGKLEVLKFLYNKNEEGYWLCRCECGDLSEVRTNCLTSKHTESCGCARLDSITTSYEDITGTWYGIFQRNAKKRGFEFNLSKQYLQEILDRQNHKCALSGLPIHIEKCRSGKEYYEKTTASLDRIDNTKGYEEGNVQFLHKHVNYMKWTHDQDYFIELCRKITNNVANNQYYKASNETS